MPTSCIRHALKILNLRLCPARPQRVGEEIRAEQRPGGEAMRREGHRGAPQGPRAARPRPRRSGDRPERQRSRRSHGVADVAGGGAGADGGDPRGAPRHLRGVPDAAPRVQGLHERHHIYYFTCIRTFSLFGYTGYKILLSNNRSWSLINCKKL